MAIHLIAFVLYIIAGLSEDFYVYWDHDDVIKY